MRFFQRPLAYLLALAALFAVGGGSPARAAGPDYLGRFDAVALLPPPPTVGNAEDQADRQSAFEVYAKRTAADIARAKAEHDFDVFVYQPEIGAFFTPDRFPKTARLFAEVIKEARPVIDRAKHTWNRERPYVLDPLRFNRPADTESSASYPSGHSTRATVMAFLLVQEFPEHRDAIFAKSRLIGWTRVEAGVHTPLDIYAGRVLGQALARVVLSNPRFKADLAAAEAEAHPTAARH